MNDKIYTIEEIKEKVISIATNYNLKSITLFGSYARGEATKDSDIDLIINFDSESTFLNILLQVYILH